MSVIRTLNNWINYRRTVSELRRLNSRALEDLGITREQIPVLLRAQVR